MAARGLGMCEVRVVGRRVGTLGNEWRGIRLSGWVPGLLEMWIGDHH